MFQDFTTTLMVSLLVAVPTLAIALWRAQAIGGQDEIAKLGLATVRRQYAMGYGIGAVVFGFIARGVYNWMIGRYPGTGGNLYLVLAIGSAIFLTVLAFAGLRSMKRGGAVEFTAMHVIWVGGFGLLLPRLLG